MEDIIITIDLSFITTDDDITNKLEDNKNREYLVRMGFIREDDSLDNEDSDIVI